VTTQADLVRHYWERCWNERALHELGQVFHEPYQHNRSVVTVAEHAAIIEDTVRSFPDVRVEIVDIAETGDTVITRARFVGTHGGEVFGIAPTSRAISAPTLDAFFFRDGRVATLWHLTDHLPILRDIGVEAQVAGQPVDLA
jgi:predicted ester cyclase